MKTEKKQEKTEIIECPNCEGKGYIILDNCIDNTCENVLMIKCNFCKASGKVKIVRKYER